MENICLLQKNNCSLLIISAIFLWIVFQFGGWSVKCQVLGIKLKGDQ